MSEQITELEGFIAYFDMLGFSNSIQYGNNFSKKINKYREILFEAIEVDASNLEYVSFSDSVIINSTEKNEETLLELLWALSEILFRMLTELEVAMCGCLSVGTFTKIIDEDNNVMITGTPILDAIHYEKQQNWVGIMLSPKIIKEYPTIREKIIEKCRSQDDVDLMKHRLLWLSCTQRYSEIPFSNGLRYDGYVIIPKNQSTKNLEELRKDMYIFIDKLDEMSLFASDIHSQNKYSETRQMIYNFLSNMQSLYFGSYGPSLLEVDLHKMYGELHRK